MKRIVYFIVIILIAGCDSDKGLNCFQAAGDIVQIEVPVAPFTKILVWERSQLFIKQGPIQKVVVETGDNLYNDIDLQVIDGRLNIFNNNGCNVVRDYALTKVYVTAPNISEIRNSSGFTVESIGALNYPYLKLLSEDREMEDEFHKDGDFRLLLETESLEIVANGLSKFFLSGTANEAFVGFYSGDNRLEAENLTIQDLSIFHRSSNKMIVNPQQSIRGTIYSTGDVISKNRPPIVEVDSRYTGQLIFE